MMMRYLGLGIGHLNSPDFPHEAHEIFVTDEDQELPVRNTLQERADSSAASDAGAERDERMEVDEVEDEDEEVIMYDL
jgi:hypothetical protein